MHLINVDKIVLIVYPDEDKYSQRKNTVLAEISADLSCQVQHVCVGIVEGK